MGGGWLDKTAFNNAYCSSLSVCGTLGKPWHLGIGPLWLCSCSVTLCHAMTACPDGYNQIILCFRIIRLGRENREWSLADPADSAGERTFIINCICGLYVCQARLAQKTTFLPLYPPRGCFRMDCVTFTSEAGAIKVYFLFIQCEKVG